MNLSDQEINEQVARKLGFMKGEPCADNCTVWYSHTGAVMHGTLDYCHDIQAAWEIVEFVSQKHAVHVLTGFRGKPWDCTTWSCDIGDHPGNKDHWVISESAVTAPMAICLAFLKLP